MLVVNQASQSDFLSDALFYANLRRVKNTMGKTTLEALYMYALGNIVAYNDSALTTIPYNYKSSLDFFNQTI